MASPIMTSAAAIICKHAANVAPLPSQPRVRLGGAPALTIASPMKVEACPGDGVAATVQSKTGSTSVVEIKGCIAGVLNPASGAKRVRVCGLPALVQSSDGFSLPGNEPLSFLTPGQHRVVAT